MVAFCIHSRRVLLLNLQIKENWLAAVQSGAPLQFCFNNNNKWKESENFQKRNMYPYCYRLNFLSRFSVCSQDKEFEGYSSADISRSWKTLFEDGRQRLDCLLWVTPPLVVLKLNFDGNYIRELYFHGQRNLILAKLLISWLNC